VFHCVAYKNILRRSLFEKTACPFSFCLRLAGIDNLLFFRFALQCKATKPIRKCAYALNEAGFTTRLIASLVQAFSKAAVVGFIAHQNANWR